ncbi:hypothetical protein ACYT69_10155, partial [Streptococcus pyogenes]
EAVVVVAEITAPNPNVLLEIGYAWGRGIPTVLIRKRKSSKRRVAHPVPFDLRNERRLDYSDITELALLLSEELAKLFASMPI